MHLFWVIVKVQWSYLMIESKPSIFDRAIRSWPEHQFKCFAIQWTSMTSWGAYPPWRPTTFFDNASNFRTFIASSRIGFMLLTMDLSIHKFQILITPEMRHNMLPSVKIFEMGGNPKISNDKRHQDICRSGNGLVQWARIFMGPAIRQSNYALLVF